MGVDMCSREPASGVRNGPQLSAAVRVQPLWPQSRRVYGKSRKNESFSICQKMWSCRFAVPRGKVAKTCLSRRVRRCGHVVLRGRGGTLRHSTCVRRNLCAPPSWPQSCRAYGKRRKTCLSRRVRRCGHVFLRGRRGTL